MEQYQIRCQFCSNILRFEAENDSEAANIIEGVIAAKGWVTKIAPAFTTEGYDYPYEMCPTCQEVD